MAELDYITIKGFKSIASIEKLPLHSINVLIGQNGSGKSSGRVRGAASPASRGVQASAGAALRPERLEIEVSPALLLLVIPAKAGIGCTISTTRALPQR